METLVSSVIYAVWLANRLGQLYSYSCWADTLHNSEETESVVYVTECCLM